MLSPGFEILLEDEAVLGVAKPTGIATQAPPGIDSLETRIKIYLAGSSGDPRGVYLGLPHRLDRAASGAMIFAKTRRAARVLSRQFERRRVRKLYWACAAGCVEPAAGTWTDFLWKVYGQPRAMVVESTHVNAQQAVLHYRVIGRHALGSWLEIELETGRTHQVRVQAASRGFPIVGDALYGSEVALGPAVADERLRPIALHARSLVFWHPTSQAEVRLLAPLGDQWNGLQLEPVTSPTPGS
ncbi:MAG TPA: RluA family pseudouridine synthase [Pirellulales bacterium]|jgi:23S rRNA pseudouridine1911/1915/1917 synthase|nr:RluA family pseudouridine synthase [Pirellulales bacterium]